MSFTRPSGSSNELDLAFTCEDMDLSQTVVKQLIARILESTARRKEAGEASPSTTPALSVIQPALLDSLPEWPSLPVGVAGAAFGLLAGSMMARIVAPRESRQSAW
jgi:uncharacterized protein involved in exopolysaccharide biosynthesis